MPPATDQIPLPAPPSSYAQPASFRRRAVAFVLAAAANILLIAMLLGLAPTPFGPPPRDRTPATFRLLPDRPREDASRTPARKPRPAGGRPAPKVPSKAPAPTPAKAAEAPPAPPLAMIVVTKDVLRATDQAMNTRGGGSPSAGTAGGGSGTSAGAGDGQGEGPGGERLYNAEWYREPTNAEVNGYLPKGGSQSGWGEIACRTIEGNRVEDCVELGQSPPGSGFARAVRQAAWQFRVRPPRIGDRRVIGAWVRIRITYGITKE